MDSFVKKTISVTLVAIATGAASGIFLTTAVHALFYAPDENSSVTPPVTYSENATTSPLARPERIRIPSLSIDAKVQSVGVNSKGNMSAPSNFTDVGWYKAGTVPGDLGSAVIDGHVDNGLSLAGVFKHLADIKIGTDIFIDTKGGQTMHFKVAEVRSYPLADVPVESLFNKHDRPRLNLITCEGGWVQSEKTYDHRLVVYSVLEN